ncbi:hypothetical protein [Limosilactobacillus mucosae]|uniref:hypothetical protein n=1 Tax=Limosilactobacillus mucosae TaxID=97478 RepID=UPI0022E10BF9|nr:hypothetical protein [Limosilactobacillus mucosae]
MSNLLLDERPLIVLPSLAAMLNSLDEAVILQQIHYWIEKRQNYREGRYWVYNSMENWMQQFPWIKSRTTLTRYFNNLEKKGLLITGNYNKAGFDKTKWYTIDYSTLSDFEQRLYRTCTTSDQNLVNGMNRTCTTNTIDYTEITSESTTNKQANAVSADADLSESFNKLWNLYPKKQGKKDAFRHYKAWRKKSKDNTDDYLLRKLNEYKAYLTANQWLHPMNGSTWFNGRFDDDYSTANSQGYQPLQQPQGDGGFAQKLVDGKWTQNEINVAVKGIKNLSPQQKAYYVQPIDQEGNTRYRLDYLAGKAIPISDALDRL